MNRDRLAGLAVIAGAAMVAVIGARDYAGGWNDGSRLATVESVVDRGTLAIDDSIFVAVPSGGPSPYPPDDADLGAHGTRDKLRIGDHFYSDKTPVPSLLIAAVYAGAKSSLGLDARRDPRRFCYWMTLASSGLAFIVAVASVFGFAGALGLAGTPRAVLTASFAAATIAASYARHVNQHVLLLAVAAALLFVLTPASDRPRRLLVAGALAGLGYSIDPLAGPLLFAAAGGLVVFRARRASPIAWFAAGALPWIALHHALNYRIGGSFAPNAVPEYLAWPGSPFDVSNMSGILHHGPVDFFVYAAALLFGKRGFLFHDLPLLLMLPAAVALARAPIRERAELLAIGVWCLGTWLSYALVSNNYSGACVSIRWFVPLLAAGYYVLAVFLREHPERLRDLVLLSVFGALIGALAWWKGPWTTRLLPLYWPIVAAALVTWWIVGRLPPSPPKLQNHPRM